MDFNGQLLILDGGLATEIERQGTNLLNDPLWSARLLYTAPHKITDVHKSFLHHGADIITTASYQASIDGFKKYLGLSKDISIDMIKRSVTLAKEARDWFMEQPESQSRSLCPLIAGSVGPFGACLSDGSEYTGSYIKQYSDENIREWHRPRIEALLEADVDILAIETIPALKEAELLIDLLKEYPNARAWISFSCKDENNTYHGDVFAEAVKTVSKSPQVLAVGINCTPPQYIESLLDSVQDSAILPLIVYPNSGEGWGGNNIGWYGDKLPFITQCKNWIEKDVKIIGGCCRVTPEDINIIRKTVHTDNTFANENSTL